MPAPSRFHGRATTFLLASAVAFMSPALVEAQATIAQAAISAAVTSNESASAPIGEIARTNDVRPEQRVPAAIARRFEPHMWLHVSFGVLQALDVHSTLRAVTNNGHEANPLLQSVADNPAALSAIKAGMTAATIFANERLWKTHRRAALILMLAENAVYLTIVAHNYSVAGRP